MTQKNSRRSVLAAGGAGALAALAGCATYGDDTAAPAQPATRAPQPPVSLAPGETPPPVKGIATVADIPVGGGKIFKAQKVVIVQPSAGTIKAFSTVCTHQGCDVDEIAGGTINCPCHHSRFKVADGSVAQGPAQAPLPPVNVTVSGGQIVLA